MAKFSLPTFVSQAIVIVVLSLFVAAVVTWAPSWQGADMDEDKIAAIRAITLATAVKHLSDALRAVAVASKMASRRWSGSRTTHYRFLR
jgi:hypothetical protein